MTRRLVNPKRDGSDVLLPDVEHEELSTRYVALSPSRRLLTKQTLTLLLALALSPSLLRAPYSSVHVEKLWQGAHLRPDSNNVASEAIPFQYIWQ